MTRVELIYDTDCPNVHRARKVLLKGFSLAGLQPSWVEWDRKSAEGSAYVREFGSPTILVNGQDVAGVEPDNGGPSCRLYQNGSAGFAGVPSAEQVAEALSRNNRKPPITAAQSSGSWNSMAAVPGIAFAFLPKLACPLCWPAYAGLLTSLGIGFLLDTAYLFPLTAVFLALAVGSLAFRARARWGYGPFLTGLAAAIVLLIGKFVLGSNTAMYGGIRLLIVATAWNVWPRKFDGVSSCSQCDRETRVIEIKNP